MTGRIWLVLGQEFRIRLRTGRWRWLLGAWVVLLAVFTGLLDLTVGTGYGYERDDSHRGVPLFGLLMLFVLGMMLVISPALTSQTINGDRERGTLATLQVTRLSATDIALGKLLAGWGVGIVALVLTIPFAVYAMANGGITLVRMLAVYGVVAILIGVVCAVSQALSALLARSITSALLSYLSVAALTVGTVISFALIAPLFTEFRTSTSPEGSYAYETVRQDKVWWLLAPNPFVVVADSAPQVPPRLSYRDDSDVYMADYDPLSAIGRAVRSIRLPPNDGYYQSYEASRGPAVWPWGLGVNVLLGVGSTLITIRRLRTPARRLAKGVRIA